MENKEIAVQEVNEIQIPHDQSYNNLGIWNDPVSFEFAQRKAKALAQSTMVPKNYQGNLANSLIAIDIADRVKISPLAVMQNLYIVNGNPAWSSQFIVTMINNSRRFKTPLKFKLEGKGDNLTCYAYAVGQDGEEVKGVTITMEMAKKEGWTTKSGSKWQTMPEQMIQYRAASFFGRLHCPDLLMGIYAEEEAASFTVEEKTEVPRIDFSK